MSCSNMDVYKKKWKYLFYSGLQEEVQNIQYLSTMRSWAKMSFPGE